MTETDLQLGGGYTYQWECAILLALNYFFEPVKYNPTLWNLITDFLGEVAEIHLEGEDRESGVDLEDINLLNADGDRRILIQVKTKQAEGERWTLTDPLLLKVLYRFYDSRFFVEQPGNTRFVFLTNRPFNPDLVRVKSAISKGTIADCVEADSLCQYLNRYANREKKTSIDTARFRALLARHLGVDPGHVHAYVVGEHGDSEVLTWSLVTVGGMPLEEFCRQNGIDLHSDLRGQIDHAVRDAAYHIIDGKGSTYYGIGAALARIADAILRDQRSILTICTPVPQVLDVCDVTVSLPHLIGSEGVLATFPLPLDPGEEAALRASEKNLSPGAK